MVKHLGLDDAINRMARVFKIHLPYTEADHVLNIAYNLLCGGTCLEHLEWLRTNEVYLDALDADRIPDPTTAGDFCRRFEPWDVFTLSEAFNQTRLKVWSRQPDEFFDEAFIDADGTMVETTGECKQGIDINHKGQWGYHPLIVSLANTGEPLYIHNRSGSRPSHEDAARYLNFSVDLCRKAGFRKVTLRGDTDFSQTEHLDRWHDDGVRFIFGFDAMPNLYEYVENLDDSAWKPLTRRPRYKVKTQPRRKPENVKQRIVQEREFKNIRTQQEYVAEFEYQPGACSRRYRMIVVWKDLETTQGQLTLFNDRRCFFYITNDDTRSAEEIVFTANDRCGQENLIGQLKDDAPVLTAPVDGLVSNAAYMTMAGLAWSLKIWMALLLPENGRWAEKHAKEKQKLLRMNLSTFRKAFIDAPAQIVRSGRRIVYRLLSWNAWQPVFFRLLDQLNLSPHH